MQKGLIVEIQDENRKLYQTEEATAIEDYLKQRQHELKEIIPYLKQISNTEIPSGSVSVSYGPTRLRAAFSSIFDLKSEVLIWTLPKNVSEVLGDWFLEEMNEKIIKHKMPVKIIYSKSFNPEREIKKSESADVRYVDEETTIFTIACSDLVFLIVLGTPLTVLEMKSANIAAGFKSRFFTIWDKSLKNRDK